MSLVSPRIGLVVASVILAASAFPIVAGAASAAPPPNPSPSAALDKLSPAAERTQVMVLGTFHMRELEGRFRPSMVNALLDRLAAFKPDVVAVETLPGPFIHELELRRDATSIHAELLDGFAGTQLALGHEAQSLLKTDMIAASKAAAAPTPRPADSSALVRRALLSLAAYDLPDALLAWSAAPPADPARAQVPAALAAKLDAQLARVNEVQVVALPLARRLGHAEIACVDDFEAPEAMEPLLPALENRGKESPLFAAVGKAAVYEESERRKRAAVAAGDLLPYLRWLNSPAYAALDVDAQWGVFLRAHLKSGADRGRLALWENRNLKIAARIRALTARYVGKRVLVIYGAAHKPFLDAYLGACSDLEVVQPETVLK